MAKLTRQPKPEPIKPTVRVHPRRLKAGELVVKSAPGAYEGVETRRYSIGRVQIAYLIINNGTICDLSLTGVNGMLNFKKPEEAEDAIFSALEGGKTLA